MAATFEITPESYQVVVKINGKDIIVDPFEVADVLSREFGVLKDDGASISVPQATPPINAYLATLGVPPLKPGQIVKLYMYCMTQCEELKKKDGSETGLSTTPN